MRKVLGRLAGSLLLATAIATAAPASAAVMVAVDDVVVRLDPGSGWAMTQAFFQGEPMTAISANGTAVHSSSGWAGETHGNVIVETVSFTVDDTPLVAPPPDGGFLVGQERVRIDRRIFLGGVARLDSTIIVSASGIVDQVELRSTSAAEPMDFVYTHLGSRANALTRLTAHDISGATILSLTLDDDGGQLHALPRGTLAIEQWSPATRLHVRTSWTEPTDGAFVIDRSGDQKLYHRSRALEGGTGWIWSGTQSIHVWRE